MIHDLVDVRLAAPADEEALLDLCRADHVEHAFRDGTGKPFPFSVDRVRALVQRSFVRGRNDTDGTQSFCGVIGSPLSGLEAAIYLTQECCMYYSDRPVLKEVFSIVRPEFRRSSHARSLTAFSKIIAACLEQTLIAEVSAQRIEARERFYARNYGTERVGAVFAFDPMRA